MSKLTKNQKLASAKVEAGKAYTLKEAAELVKEITTTKFDASVDIDVRLGVDPRKANQMVRGVVSLPNGTGKQVRVLALCTPDQEAAATEAGADYVGLDEYIDKIKGGWTDVDVIITMPAIMGKLGALGRVLGPRGLMPNPKSGTVTNDVAGAVKEVKQLAENKHVDSDCPFIREIKAVASIARKQKDCKHGDNNGYEQYAEHEISANQRFFGIAGRLFHSILFRRLKSQRKGQRNGSNHVYPKNLHRRDRQRKAEKNRGNDHQRLSTVGRQDKQQGLPDVVVYCPAFLYGGNDG